MLGAMSSVVIGQDPALQRALTDDGFAFVAGGAMRELLSAHGSLADWPAFAASWDALEVDTYMADRGRYRRRRHAVFRVGADGAIERQPHQPHYQSLDYNTLNGGVERWFEPVLPEIASGATMRTLLRFCQATFGALAPNTRA